MSNRLQKLRDKRSKALDRMRQLTDSALDQDRDLSEEEQKEYGQLEASVDGVNGLIERETKLVERERAAALAVEEPEPEPDPSEVLTREDLVPGAQRGRGRKPTRKGPFASFGEQLTAVINAGRNPHNVDQRLLVAASGANEAVPSEGGFMVQEDYAAGLLERTYETGAILSRISTIPISSNSNSLKLKGIDETSRATGSRFGGIQTYWADEAATVTAQKPKFRELTLSLKKLMGISYLTEELIQDAAALQAVVSAAFAQEFSFMLEDAFFEGSGAGQPLGFMNSPALVTVAKEATQAAAGIVKENIFNMWSRMWGRSRQNAVWLINQDAEPQLFGITLGQLGIYFPAGTFANNTGFGTLFGRPVIPVEYASTMGTLGDITFVDPSQYLMIDKGGFQQAQSIHVRFLYDELTLKFTYRVDGQPLWHSPLTPFKGSNTQSPFVALATRP